MVLTLVRSIRKPWTTSALVARKVTGVSGRHDDALRRERVLLADRAHRDRAVRLDGAAEIALDEFAGEVKRLRVGGLDPGLRHRRLVDAGEGRHADQQRDDGDRQDGPSPLDAGGDRRALVVADVIGPIVIAPIRAAGTQ